MSMKPWMVPGLLVLAAGCPGSDDDDNLPEPLTTGTVVEDATGRSAEAATYKAFGFATNGIGVVYMSANPDATCDSVYEYLTASDAYDPSGVLVADHCNLAFRFKYPDADGFDNLELSDAEIENIWNVNCAMGEGQWVLSGSGRERDYFFTPDDEEAGGWWQGYARTWTSTVSVGADSNTPDVTLSLGPDLGGQFIYEDTNPDPGTGTISGTVTSERCQKLVQTPLYSE